MPGRNIAEYEKKEGARTDLYREPVEVTKTKALSSAGINIRRANEAEKLAKIDGASFCPAMIRAHGGNPSPGRSPLTFRLFAPILKVGAGALKRLPCGIGKGASPRLS